MTVCPACDGLLVVETGVVTTVLRYLRHHEILVTGGYLFVCHGCPFVSRFDRDGRSLDYLSSIVYTVTTLKGRRES